jgi:hypothetical protein
MKLKKIKKIIKKIAIKRMRTKFNKKINKIKPPGIKSKIKSN